MLWVLFALMAACVVVGTLWPLGRQERTQMGRHGKAMAIYEDQLAEVDRDTERGLITPEEGRAAQVEIKRRMLATSEREEVGHSASGRAAIFVAALIVPLAGLGLYWQVGAPEIPSMPFAERGAEQDDARQLQTLVTELRNRLENDPQGGETRGWELLASTYMNMGRADLAVEAFSQIVERDEATSATWSQYADTPPSPWSRRATPPMPASCFWTALRRKTPSRLGCRPSSTRSTRWATGWALSVWKSLLCRVVLVRRRPPSTRPPRCRKKSARPLCNPWSTGWRRVCRTSRRIWTAGCN